ncbi:class II glutamine amidotransferase [Lacimicrobium alkaliphilum]|uniref:Class II glutamine amidotransferase n=1 Tax=Lacimicrobium alkaliphilum TaxID=1526571 RepID=A0A0U2QM50_9ALTE|nr:class II glutamine amidotransferase [Lacimicrobium alkaliphilum]ALS98491.1 class II glutamine amidotransferase [Lacimicrobium alkaliphilum]
MCELLGMSANVPTDICFSFKGLRERGGRTGPHKDGWGVAFYNKKGVNTFKDPNPSHDSEIANLVSDYPMKSCAVLAHIRQANRGRISLENTHPFTRELWGRYWTYAHNGQLSEYKDLPYGPFTPVGTTDSEYAFCYLLSELANHYPNRAYSRKAAFRFIQKKANKLHQRGVFNMLLSDGDYLLAYCSTKLYWITRRAPFSVARLSDLDVDIDFTQHTTIDDVVTVIATEPLTNNEQWKKMQPGEGILFKLGEVVVKSGG